MLLAGIGDLVVTRPLRHLRQRPPDSLLGLLEEADLAVGNLEVPLTEVNDPQRDGIALRADPHLLEEVASAGLNVLSLANNHAADQGWSALAGLASRCRVLGITPLGVGESRPAALAPALRQVGGLRVGFVAATCVAMERFLAAGARPGMAGVRSHAYYELDRQRSSWEPGFPPRAIVQARDEDVEALLAAVAEARRQADLAVAVMHWGVSHQPAVADYQRPLARSLVEAGAGLVIGCHAHDLQGVEVIEGAPVFYGLGSFVFGYDGPGAATFPRDSAVALVDVGGEGLVTGARLVLGYLDDQGEPRRAAPARAEHMAEQLRRWSAGWGAGMDLQGDTITIPLDNPQS